MVVGMVACVQQAAAADASVPGSVCCVTQGAATTAALGREFHAEGPVTFFSKLVDTADFPARWYCGVWSSDVGWLHVASDVAIFAAYAAIPFVLLCFLLRRRDLPFPRVVWLFAAFILSCGLTHLIEAAIFWWPVYRLSGLVKAVTAIVSWMTVLMLARVLPEALNLPSAALLSKQIKKDKERLRFALEAGEIGVWEVDLSTHVISWDKTCCQIFDIDLETEVNMERIIAGIHPDDRERVQRALNASLQQGTAFDMQYRFLHRDGSVRHIRGQGKVLFGEDGKAETFTGVCLDFTKKQLLDDAILESENNFRTTFEQVAMGIAHVAPDGTWLRVNKGLCDIIGYTESELLRCTFQQITHPDDLDADLHKTNELLSGKIDSYSMEKRYLCKDGTHVWGNLTVSLVRDASGEPKHFISLIENVQGRKDAEAKLLQYTEQIQKLSLVASKTKHSVVISDAEGRIEWVNDAFTQLTGYRLDEVVGEYAGARLRGSDTDPATVALIEASVMRRESVAVEIVNYRKSGCRYWVDLKIDPVFNEQGELTQFIGTQVDITERKNAELELRKQQNRFARLLRSDIVGITMCRLSGEVEQANDEMLRMIGYSQQELDQGHLNWRELTPAELLPMDEEAIQELTMTGAVKPYGKELICKDGSRVPVFLGATLLDDEDDLILCFVLDASLQKASEAKLMGAKHAAEKASMAKSEFLAAMSHELRTPLNGVIGMTELLSETGLDARQQRFLNACQSSGKALMTLINDILDFSKIEAGRLELDEHPFDLLELLDDVMTSMPLRLDGKNVEVLYHLDHPSTLSLVGDSNRLRQILFNLIGNAIKFTAEGEVTLLAEPLQLSEREATIRFTIADTGIGIPRDRLDRLFRSFSQMDSSTSRQYGGSGLGLSISKGLVEAMGGAIGVKSEVGVGSQFWFTLSFERSDVPKLRERIEYDELHQLRVLVVEDNEESRKTLVSMMQGWEMSVVSAGNAEDALEQLRKSQSQGTPFDLALINMTLPDMNGCQLGQRLRADVACKEMLLILMAPIEQEIPAASNAVFDRHVRKPLGQSVLLSTIVDCCCKQPPLLASRDVSTVGGDGIETPVTHSDIRILVAEDNATNQLFVHEILRSQDWPCDFVGNGREAVEAAVNVDYDMILMDCQMPEVDGYDATRQIREREADGRLVGRLPILALTANAVKGDHERCLDAGMDDYISKPFHPDQLTDAINRFLRQDVDQPFESLENADRGHAVEPRILTPIDSETFFNRCMGDMEFASSLLDSFMEDGRDRFDEICAHAKRGDAVAAGAVAHGLKGIAGIVAAHDVQSVSAKVESAGKAGKIEVLRSLIDDLREVVDECLGYVPMVREQANQSAQNGGGK
ncbi:Signal transduction histidine-protein kinase BarA [Novipirellula galeiformis]|uniref:Sensory/regulatory protein RpfC n=2 Tax=Novipirellula galeiformis TaxID=2528004 RepID=A0A5C6CCG1_9BACT|nr:Signal transduction histidine-protein kinase BarA [Novipirellula galeiformis]